MTKVELVKAFKGFEGWMVSGDENHLRADYKTNNVVVEFGTNLVDVYFLKGDPIKVQIPYSEMKYNETTGCVHVPNMLGVISLQEFLEP